jgi:dihydroorotate dehydrogenase (fumarate)
MTLCACQPGIDPEGSESASQAQLSDSSELQLRPQWLVILFGRVRTSLAARGGVHEPLDAVRAVLAGADVVQLLSCLLRHGSEYLDHIRLEFEQWGQKHEYASIEQMRGRASIASEANPEQFERTSLIRLFQSWRRPGS